MLLSLTIICAGAGAILAGVNDFTKAPIAASKAAALENAIKEVTPPFDNNPTQEAYKAVSADGDSLLIYPAKKGGELIGVAVPVDQIEFELNMKSCAPQVGVLSNLMIRYL